MFENELFFVKVLCALLNLCETSFSGPCLQFSIIYEKQLTNYGLLFALFKVKSSIVIQENSKINAFSRISKYLNEKQSLILYNSFITSQFNYCTLIWMFCGKAAKKELNHSHKRALRILRNDYFSPFEELLQKSNECTIHIKKLKN